MDFLMMLPKELSLNVLSYLSGKDLSVVCQVCKRWRDLANYNLLWKKLCSRETILEDNEILDNAPVNEESDLEPICKWAQIYYGKKRLLSNWASDTYIWLAVDQEKPSVDICNNKLAVVYWKDKIPTIDILHINEDSLRHMQTLTLPFNLDRQTVGVCIHGTVLIVEISNISIIYNYESYEYIYEILVIPNLNIVCPIGEEQHFVNKYHSNVRCWILCIAGRYIWYQASASVIIYDRLTKTFQYMDNILQVVAVEIQRNLIVVQCPHSVRVFSTDGKLLYNYSKHSNLFYTSLVMSSTSFGFLQSEDFSDLPHVVQVELDTWKIYRVTHLKVYRIALHKNAILLLSQDPFTITSMCEEVVRWESPIRGTKYLRPGKDFFTIICSRYLFVCPSLARLDMFSLYDVNNGTRLYDTSLSTSSYNIQSVSNSCLIVRSKKTNVNIRSYV